MHFGKNTKDLLKVIQITTQLIRYLFVWKTKYSYPIFKGRCSFVVTRSDQGDMQPTRNGTIRGNVRSNHIHVLVSVPSYLSPAQI